MKEPGNEVDARGGGGRDRKKKKKPASNAGHFSKLSLTIGRAARSPDLRVFERESASAALNYVISEIAGSDMATSMAAIRQLVDVVKAKPDGYVVNHVEQVRGAQPRPTPLGSRGCVRNREFKHRRF